jgi:hypothetical protein
MEEDSEETALDVVDPALRSDAALKRKIEEARQNDFILIA